MQEDKKLKELLAKHAIEETPVDFTDKIMRRIESTNSQTQFVLHPRMKLFALSFIVVCMLLLLMSNKNQSFQVNTDIPSEYVLQIIRFLVIFWIVMLINLFWKKHQYNN